MKQLSYEGYQQYIEALRALDKVLGELVEQRLKILDELEDTLDQFNDEPKFEMQSGHVNQ
jgi:hypothetical protein